MFKPVESQPSLPKTEERILQHWDDNAIFARTLENRAGSEEYVFYDGPPFATGLPHYGHLLAGTIKDVVPRYQTMRGRYVDRVFGWDCHGLPVEYEMEKALGISGKRHIEEYGIGKFNESCRGIVLRYTKEWESVVRRIGRWVDFDRGYRTMDLPYMESIWWVFKQFWDKGLVYEGNRILPYCPRCSTPLSNFEANQGYEEVEDPAITVRFRDAANPSLYYLAWTTTPWTLPSNTGLAVGPGIDYVKVKDGGCEYVLAESRLSGCYPDASGVEIVERFKGAALDGARYLPLFEYFAGLSGEGAFRVVCADFVSTEDGTGIVHIAPGFGEDDAETGRLHGLPEVCPVDEEGCFTEQVGDFAGVYVKDADKELVRRLKESGSLVRRSTIRHNYPHCWRDDTPLIYRAVSTWFIRIEPIKEMMLKANSQINWVPAYIKDGRFGKWLENARDWSISRNRYWGNPLPIWRNSAGECICVGSVAELEKLSGVKVDDIHKHFVDDIEIPSSCGGEPLRRIPEVLDCWFESGAMPYAQMHYPFENKERFESHFPADFIAEGLDQTRGWFYTLVVLGAALFDKPAFSNVVVNGLILAEDGQKMSKRKKNYPDPQAMFDSYGADALRLFLLGSPVVRGEDLKFSEDSIKEVLRSVILPLWNSYSFFVTYANVDNWTAEGDLAPPADPEHPLDRWILSSMSEMIEEIRDHMDSYQLQRAANRFEKFIDDLTNWYIRRSRRRFWKSQNDTDKADAYRTLYYVLVTFCKTAAPFIPFVTEEIYLNLKSSGMPGSVHLCDYPESICKYRDPALEKQMEYTMRAVSLGRFLRARHKIKVRQPLQEVTVVVADAEARCLLEGTSDIIAEELNVKKVSVGEKESELVSLKVKADFRRLGPRLGPKMKEFAALISSLDDDSVKKLLDGRSVVVKDSEGAELELAPEDVNIHREEREGLCVANEGDVTVALDVVLTQALEDEGFAREFVSRVQNTRKEMGLEVADRVKLCYCMSDARFSGAVAGFSDYICSETLAVSLDEDRGLLEDGAVRAEINGHDVLISLIKTEA